jgi:adenine-specific DNA methylase
MPAVTTFAGKASASSEKLRGGYYTPEPIARFLADWVAPAGPRVLEPSCGDGAILRFLTGSELTAVELEAEEAAKARQAVPTAAVHEGDFFEWFGGEELASWDGVAGNPPFIRFQRWTEPTRSLAFDLMREVGLRPTKLTNAWVPFIVAAALALREGGRAGLVVPAELLQVFYAAQLRGFLVDAFAELTAVTFKRLLFDGVLQEVVLLLGVRGKGPASIRVVEVEDAGSLPDPTSISALPHAPALEHDTEKWTKYFLDSTGIKALRRARGRAGVVRLGELADVDVGVVTGRNQFFVLRPSGVQDRMLAPHVRPLVSKSAHVQGIQFSHADLALLADEDAPCNLLAVDQEFELDADAALQAYVEAGEAEDVHTGYKCSIRKRWWVVPSTWVPDAFLLRQIYQHPRIVANHTGATTTDTIHRVRMLNGTTPRALAAASINSMTFAFAEVMGRSYGGGVLELEPREAEALPFPDPHGLSPATIARVDDLLRRDELLAALDVVDEELLIRGLGLPKTLVASLRGVWERLKDRRLGRG